MAIKNVLKKFAPLIVIKCIEYLNKKRGSRTQNNALFRMIREGRFVLLHPYAGLKNDPRLIRETALDVIEDLVSLLK
jgi:hypothetical protein